MATFTTSWLLSILLVSLPNHVAPAGLPAAPSPPECYIPCDETDCWVDIHCTWDPRPDPQIPANYSLHWEQANREEGHVLISTSSSSEVIHREKFSNHGELRVWVQAKNQHGFVKSPEAVFNTTDINKPPPPIVTSNHHDPEINWKSPCDQLHLTFGHCYVRHRTEAEDIWTEELGGVHEEHTLDSLEPCIVYEFQVRCACDTGIKSDWSEIHRIQNKEVAPVGELDLWRDCSISIASFDCLLTWKLSSSQACVILGYEVRLSYNNGTAVLLNVSTAESLGQLVCEMKQCRFTFPLNDVSTVNVLAYNAHGAAVLSYLSMPIPELRKNKDRNELALDLKMNEENLTVSWDRPSWLSDNLKEYVVQYKQAASPPGQEFDWLKVDKNQTTGFFKGPFKKCTPYRVSLFTVSHSNEVNRLSSVVEYSLHGTPSKVLSFKVFSIAATRVTLLWDPVLPAKETGLIMYYQIGVDRQKVYNVSASPQHEKKTFELLNLSPEQEYEVWIRAVTVAGPGANATVTFKTKHSENFGYIHILLGLLLLFSLCVAGVLVSACRGEKSGCPLVPKCFYDKVPDPSNSHIFKQMKHQMNDSLTWICFPVYEPYPKVSLLEVVESDPLDFKSSVQKPSDPDGLTRPVVGDRCSWTDCQDEQREDAITEECHRTGSRPVREAYSKMVDSEGEDREDCGSSSSEEEEEQDASGYEKHFMPTVLEIQRVC